MSELICENIGGLLGKFSFNFKKGINILNAPNSSGKSSIINAIKLSCEGDWENENLIPYLNDKTNYGTVELKFNEFRQKVSITRDKQEVRFLSKELDYKDKRTKNLSFLMKDSPLNLAISKADEREIERWFYDITDLDYYEIAQKRTESLFRQYNQEKSNLENKLKGSLNELKKLRTEFNNEKSELDKKRDGLLKSPELEGIKDKIDDLRYKIEEYDEIINKIDYQLSDYQLKLKNAEKDLNEKEMDLDEKKVEVEDLQKEILQGEEKIIELEEVYNENKERIIILEKEIQGYDEIVEGKTIHIDGIKSNLRSLQSELKKKTSIEGYDICPTCDSKLDPLKVQKRIEVLSIKVNDNEQILRKKETLLGEISKSQKDIKNEINEIENELPKRKNELDDEIRTVNSEIKGYKGTMTSLNNKISENEIELRIKEKERENLTNKLKELISPFEKVNDEISDLNVKINELTKKINDVSAKIKLFEEGTEEIKNIRKKVEITEQIVRHFSNCVSRIKNLMLDKLNNRLKESFQLLELAELDRILVTENFNIIITRKGGYETTIAELSGAERALIAFIIMVIAKNEFLPEFPMLLIDEIGEFMDKTRFLKIIDYLKEIVDILIITRNRPLEGRPEPISQIDILHNPHEII
ncbi:MAG: ATP-binding protein [Promethearchaeota archaeon]